jgi:hypothetical protein
MRKKKLRKQIAELEEQLRVTARQAHYAEVVCHWAGEMLDPASKYVLRQRQQQFAAAYKRWKEEVPHVPWRGIFFPGDWMSEPSEWPRAEWMDAEGYWHFLDTNEVTLAD